MEQDIVARALVEMIAAFGADHADRQAGNAAAAKAMKRKDVKDALAPIAPRLKTAPRAERVIQWCLEQPVEHLLHAAASVLVASRAISWTPWLAIAPGSLPKRAVERLQVAVHRPVVYAIEAGPCVSVWSLETGEHLRDLKVPGAKDAMVSCLVERSDGSLRALTAGGTVVECPADGKAFVRVHELDVERTHRGTIKGGLGHDPELRWFVTQPAVAPIEIDGAPHQRLRVFDLATREARDLTLPFQSTSERYAYVDGVMVIAARNSLPPASPDGPWREEHALVVLDLATVTSRIVPLAFEVVGDPSAVVGTRTVGLDLRTKNHPTDPTWHVLIQGAQQGPLSVAQLVDLAMQGSIRSETQVWREGYAEWQPVGAVAELVTPVLMGGVGFHRFEVDTGAVTESVRGSDGVEGSTLPDGSLYEAAIGTFVRFTSPGATAAVTFSAQPVARPFEVTGAYSLAGEPYRVVYAIDAVRGQVVVAGTDPAVEVRVIAPFGTGRVAAAAPIPAPQPLDWARPGAVLRYEIADFDAHDEWTFEVLEAGPDLVLKVQEGANQVIASALRFTEDALARATKLVALAQGGADVDVRAPQSASLPPFLVSRAVHAKLVSGKATPWKSEWTDPATKITAERSQATVRVDRVERAVAVLAASGDGVVVTVLDDAKWPLVLERREAGDNFVRLVEMDLSRVGAPGGTAPTPAPTKVTGSPTTAPAHSAAGARRFELVEGSSARFWEIAQSGASVTVRFGRIGTAGQTQVKTAASEEAAATDAGKLIREKTKKGYVEVTVVPQREA